jgi:NTP pyrophosphatase (non-canonical NTP hydrolase)
MDITSLTKDVEFVSKKYAKKYGIRRDSQWFILKLQEEMGELIQSYLMMKGKGRTKGKTEEQLRNDFHKELADVFCHVLLVAHSQKANLEKEVEKKWLKYR